MILNLIFDFRAESRELGSPSVSKPLRDVVGPDLKVLFAGINPSILSFERGHHFARPGNRFWPALHRSGWTPRLMSPDEDGDLPALGIGITNVVDRPTRAAAELSDDELRAGAAALANLVREVRPRVIAVVGIGAYRTGFGKPDATVGLQEEAIGGRPAWVLPNPSGLNAHWQLPALGEEFARLREYANA
jgi:TDG/mug DNA glycosylase family protein